ncbi:MAG TPA: dihydrofolate reductase family protein [Dongiaceae bacterium]|nr:dihydrofolate reductase family protein [Dongiaceae bacterium]
MFLFMMVSLDGYYEGVGHDLSWHNVDEEFVKFAIAQLDEVDTLVFGRKTYDMMAEFWPSRYAMDTDPETAVRMNRLRKVAFSHSEFDPHWENTEVSTELAAKIKELKANEGKGIAVLGSSHLGKQLLEANLLDEVRIMVNPCFIGEGSTLFNGLEKKMRLESTRTLESGNVLLCYVPK